MTTLRSFTVKQPTSFLFYLPPKPIVQEGIEVVLDALEERRLAIPHMVRIFGREQLAGSGGDVEQFLRFGAGLVFATCRRDDRSRCVFIRGREVNLAVWIDETRLMGGMDMLFAYDLDEVHSIELIPGCAMVRVYTKNFMERLAAGRAHLYPALPECWF